jgi:hypothetical protein
LLSQVPAPDAVFDYVMGDVLTTIVVELLVTPEQVRLLPCHAMRLTYAFETL